MRVEEGRHPAGYLVLRDSSGARHAVRPNAIMGVHEVVEDGSAALSLAGGRVVKLNEDFDEALDRLSGLAPSPRPDGR